MSDLNKINFENKLYNSFRNTIRLLLSNIKIKITTNYIQTIVEIIKSSDSNYFEKNAAIVEELKTLTSNYITFIDISYDEYKSYNSDEIKSCFNNIKCKDKFFCEYDEENKICKLKIPRINFFTNASNEENYYERLADELIRYNRIRDFIFSQRSFLNFSNNKYNLNPNELLIIESKLNDDFFNNLIPINIYNNDIIPYDIANPTNSRKNKFLKQINYNDFESKTSNFIFDSPEDPSLLIKFTPKKESQLKEILETTLEQEKIKKKTQFSQPGQLSQPVQPVQLKSTKPLTILSKTKTKTKLISDDDDQLEVKPITIKPITIKTKTQLVEPGTSASAAASAALGNFIDCTNEIGLKTYTYFNEPMKCKEFNIINSKLCSYQLILEVINNNNNTELNFNDIISNLIKKYNELFKNDKSKKIILSLWNNEGKQDISDLLANKEVNVDDIITDNTYFITTTDIMLLADIYKIPIVLFSTEEFNDFNIKIDSLNIYFLMNKEKNIKIITVRTKTTNPAKPKTETTPKKYYFIYVSKNNGILNFKLFYNNLDEFKLPETILAGDFINAINTGKSYISTILA
jgi:hypothetical protein